MINKKYSVSAKLILSQHLRNIVILSLQLDYDISQDVL